MEMCVLHHFLVKLAQNCTVQVDIHQYVGSL